MTAKEIYERIDLSQLPKDKADKLRELEVKTKGFSIQNERVDESMRNLYAQLKEKKPSALKDLKVEIKKEEIKKGDEVIVKETEKVVGKKEVIQKTPTPSSSKKDTITQVAKKIRKEGEEWRQALRRAGEEMRKRDDEASKQVKTELQKLIDFVKNDPNFKDFPRTYGKGRKDIDILKDASEKALAPGRRVSQKGHMNQYGASKGGRKYTENRDNRSDREASKFTKNIFLAKGGSVHRAELMEEGGQVFVSDQILANNSDALVNTTTMTELFAEGGMAPTRKLFQDGGALYQTDMDADYITYGEVLKSGGKLKYDPVRDVQAIVIQSGPFKQMFIKGDFLGGAYRLADGGLSENYIYVSPRKVIFARLKSGEDIKPSNGFWIKKNASGTIYTGKEKAKPAFVKSKKFPLPKKITLSYPYKENEKIMKLLGEFSGKDDFRPATTFISIKDGELVSTNAHYLIRLMDPTTKGENELVCESKSCQNIKKTDLKYPNVDVVIQSFEADFSESYDFVDLYESVMQARENVYEKLQRRSKNTYVVTNVEFKNNDIKLDSGLLLQTLKGAISLGMQKGFISYSEARNRPIVLTPSQVPTGTKYMALGEKDLILLMPTNATGVEFESTIVAKQVDIMEAGGEVFVPVQIDANNPNALVQTTTMSDLFANGGSLEGKKRFYQIDNIGKVKYSLFFHDGVTKYNDGSDFFDVRTFKNKLDLENKRQQLLKDGYTDRFEDGGMMADSMHMAQGGFVARYNGKKISIEAESLYAAQLKAIEQFKVPKSKQGLLSVVSNESMTNQDFRFMAKGGAMEHMIMEGDLVKAVYKNMLVIESRNGVIQIINLDAEPFASRIVVEKITGKNSVESAKAEIDKMVARQPSKMAKGGKIREFDDVLILSKNRLGMVELIFDGIYYITTPLGETFESTIDDLQKIVSLEEGGDVKIGEIAMIAKENKATGDEVVKKISQGADVEMKQTEDRKMAMRIAIDNLKEDFNYYEKLRKAGL